MSYAEVPGFASTWEELGETTVVVETARLLEAARHLRDGLMADARRPGSGRMGALTRRKVVPA